MLVHNKYLKKEKIKSYSFIYYSLLNKILFIQKFQNFILLIDLKLDPEK